ncbi:MAG TPA: hypothetical protein VEH84_15435 [Alphaproteobacteria bacterium]|nr:hypothetical protein [Alphaproteobacteria bacterium]
MDLRTTLIAGAAALALFLVSLFAARRPVDPLRPSLVPWVPILIAATVVLMLMLAHLATLLAGRPVGRFG